MKETMFEKKIAFTGMFAGLAVALGVPWIVLTFGHTLSSGMATALCVLAIISGGFTITVATFFGIVIPTKAVKGGGEDDKGPRASGVEIGAGKVTPAQAGPGSSNAN